MIEKECEMCGKTFYAHEYRKDTAKYCSLDCYHKSTRTDKSHVCKNCGSVFFTRHNDHKFCSVECACEYKRNRPKKAKLSKDGYKRIWLSDGSSILEHIHVMEQHIGRKLENNECVHHIDGNRSNNDFENLRLMTRGDHSSLHRKKEISEGKALFGRCDNHGTE